ncbi:hypothetical protein [Microbacterium sp. Root553]|uniref:hypothetical protein n=1 Tax=Microbacterium sp. Root553 TaxID=1736556 RepID=UPI000AB0B30D|nr:hypothetical protein [Microbacterium sp. Root553]
MDTLRSFTEARWDAPFRILASILGITLVASLFSGTSVLGTLQFAAAWLSWAWLKEVLGDIDSWATTHLHPPALGFVLLVCILLLALFSHQHDEALAESRATASVWVVAALASYSVPVGAVVGALIVGVVFRGLAERPKGTAPFWPACGWTVTNLLWGLLWAPLLLILWAAGLIHDRE